MDMIAKPGRQRLINVTSLLGVVVCLGTVFCALRVYAGFKQSEMDHQLIVAIENRKEDAAVSLLESGANPNARDEANGAALTLKEMLLAVFGKVKAPSKQGTSAIVMAFNRSEMNVAKALISRGARIEDGRDSSGIPFLLHAIGLEDLEMARILVQKDPRVVNFKDSDGDGVIAIAATQSKWEIL